MKEIEFISGETDNIEEIAKKLFIDMERQNPASIYYNRVLERPKINWSRIVLQIIIPIFIFILTIIKLLKNGAKLFTTALSCIAFCFYILLNLKTIIIYAIQFYQHFAPSSLRMKCRFEPSCSQYMLLAIEKYGVFKGLKMGIERLKRCNAENGGYDFP